MYSDASYGGIGGWSPDFHFMWRVMHTDLRRFGFPLRDPTATSQHPPPIEGDYLHINPLEFLALVVNIWLATVLTRTAPSRVGGYVLHALADNTTALSWLKHAATSDNSSVRYWARLASALLVDIASHHATLTADHIQGKLNTGADILSRLVNGSAPTWAYVTSQCSALATTRIYLLPSRLFSILADIVSSTWTEALSEKAMIELRTLEPTILPLGSMPGALVSTIVEPCTTPTL